MPNVSLVDAVRFSAMEQDREVSLHNCHTGWEGAITADTILQGVMERYRAMGAVDKVAGGVAFRRRSLKHVELVMKTSFDIELVLMSVNDGLVTVKDRDFFHKHEVDDITAWMLENVYH